ncbi:glycosyl hydrolase family 43 [Salegentibacter sp. 24]|uniref:glycoside hydrolase family 43 protein n=1 Tax=Salegentibacter sp. 24 TaxID=2183986 RepID=UPI00105F8356|nr:glycoside hydrolase family 43 protein [Salegentibacter sp. 24]TDN90346.1 glycosyl hydrolase family 43 [Salegentibacter sp. 24]
MKLKRCLSILLPALIAVGCKENKEQNKENGTVEDSIAQQDTIRYTSEPLITDHYTADPSAHVFENKIYIYPSHDFDSGIPEDDSGSHFNMKDYHVYSMETPNGEVTDHGKVLDVKDVAWAERQMWAPDAAEKNGTYYLFFPAKDKNDIFKIGVATADNPAGPFTPKENPIEGSFSIDPAVFKDSDNEYYMYFGGIWGGQLQRWQTGEYVNEDSYPEDDQPAVAPKVAKLSDDLLSFAEEPKDIQILDKNGEPITTGDNDRRFFEAAWVHKYKDKYYFSYSTGDTHKIAYATGDSPYGPFTYQGVILEPVVGWTNHHSIVEYEGKWYLFYHDSSLSEGKTYLRSMKMAELEYDEEGKIKTLKSYEEI